MVDYLVKLLTEYEERVWRCDYVPSVSYGRRMLRDDGVFSDVPILWTINHDSVPKGHRPASK